MELTSPIVVSSLVTFLSRQISERRIKYLIPVESKGALLIDLAFEALPVGEPRTEILYLRSLEYLPQKIREDASFGIFDDFVFSGGTLGRALDLMISLGIPKEHIHLMAFFKLARPGCDAEVRHDILSDTVSPGDGALLKLSQDEILRDVQLLAIKHKIPASYDNLDWDIQIDQSNYIRLMQRLSRTGWYVYYGYRGKLDASALLIQSGEHTSFSALPKIRFWYDKAKSLLRTTPISFSKAGTSPYSGHCSRLLRILTPEKPDRRQLMFAKYQAAAMSEQLALLGYVKAYFLEFGLSPQLNRKHIDRYFGPRASQVVEYLENGYREVKNVAIAMPKRIMGRYLDFYWVAVEIMRMLGKAYWTQSVPRKGSQGFSVSELIDHFAGSASVEAVHAAIDYCADMNLIATFFGWHGVTPFRAFRLTENGEREVGRNDGKDRRRLTFIEKLGSLILSKSSKQEAYWWVLEKIPAILMQRFDLPLPQMTAAMNYFGDTTHLHPRENSEYFSTWPDLATDAWSKRAAPGAKAGRPSLIFKLSPGLLETYRDDIFGDTEIVKVIGPTETLLEMIKSPMKGHHVAILLDILSDCAGGTSYLANSLRKALDLIGHRSDVCGANEKEEISHEIANWLKGLDEKTSLLTDKTCRKLFAHMGFVAKRLASQRRGELADQLLRNQPLPEKNRIVPAFRALSLMVKQVDQYMSTGFVGRMTAIAREIVPRKSVTAAVTDIESTFASVTEAINRWAVALSAALQDDDVYHGARLKVADGEVHHRVYIVAYDLIGSSGVANSGRVGADRDRYIQSVITNWFMAFGGYAQRSEFGGGDLGFGFFHSAERAVQASLWAGYHLDLLKGTNPMLKQEEPHAGFGIIEDELRSGFMEQIRSDWLSRFAKAWKREAAKVAENAGRHGRPVVAIHADMFSGVDALPRGWFGNSAELDKIPVNFIRSEAMSELPWQQ